MTDFVEDDDEDNGLPEVLLDHADIHQLVFENATSGTNVSFGRAIWLGGDQDDIYYAMLGNHHSDAKNECQLKSYQRVHSTITRSLHRSVHGVSFNRDLPQPDEEKLGDTYFGNLEHDKDHKHAEKLEFMKPHSEESVNLVELDMKAFVWYDCMHYQGGSQCIRVVQVRNGLAKLWPRNLTIEHTESLWRWMQAKIAEVPRGNPVIILFQRFHSDVLPLARRVETLIHHDLGHPINLLGIFFALQSRHIGLKTKLCLEDEDGAAFSVPIVNFGGLKEGEYIMTQFNPRRFGPKDMYLLDVRDQWVTPDYHGHVTVAKPHPWKKWTCLNHPDWSVDRMEL